MSEENQPKYCMFVEPRSETLFGKKHYCTMLKKDCIASQKDTYGFEKARECEDFLEEWDDKGVKVDITKKTRK